MRPSRAFRLIGRSLALLTGVFFLWLLAAWPPPVWWRAHWPAETAFMAMRRGSDSGAVERLYRPVPLDSIAPAMLKAATTGEDDRFWDHHGIDFVALREALGYRREAFSWASSRDRHELARVLPLAWSHRDALRGASTITQQLAKNLYLSPSRNPFRKLKEAVVTYRLEWSLGKRRILELYLNVAELGDEVWGVEAASQKYFRRPARQMTMEQAAALAGSLPFPLSSNPGHRPGRMRWRQQLILRRMRGEQVEVPRVATEDIPSASPPPDTLAPIPPPDSVPLEPVPYDSVGAVPRGSAAADSLPRQDTAKARIR